MARFCLVAVLFVIASACDSSANPDRAAARTDSAGVQTIRSSGEDLPLDWDFEPVLNVGDETEQDQAFFGVRSGGLGMDDRGHLYVLDTGNRRVQVFDTTGELVRTVGREGRGPGEFQYPVSLMVNRDGSVRVHDFARRNVARFGREGDYIDEVRAPSPLVGRVSGRGDVLLAALTASERGADPATVVISEISPADTLQLAHFQTPGPRSLFYESCSVTISLPPLFADPPPWSTTETALALVDPPHYRIQVWREGSAQIIERSIAPQEATSDVVAAELGEGREWMIGNQPCVVPTEEVAEKRGVADDVPLISRVAMSPDGFLWVMRKRVGESRGPIDVFDRSGEYLGTLESGAPWPEAFGPEGEVIALEADELDVQRVVVYKVVR